MTHPVDLTEVAGMGSVRNLAGKERGESARLKMGLADADRRGENVLVKIPSYIYAIADSFILGLFSESVAARGGLKGFNESYTFEAPQALSDKILLVLERAAVLQKYGEK